MKMKIALVLLGVSLGAHTYAKAATPMEACGNDRMQFKVKTIKGKPLSAETTPGMSRVVFIQSLNGDFGVTPLTRFAIDGSWVAADKGASYIAVDVTPGPHKVCASPQTGMKAVDQNIGYDKIDAVAGRTTYLNFVVTMTDNGGPIQAHAADQSLGFATPDMTAKRRDDDVETTSFVELDPVKGFQLAQKLPLAATTSR